jgi:peptide/nickel transport system substrate-binding protein
MFGVIAATRSRGRSVALLAALAALAVACAACKSGDKPARPPEPGADSDTPVRGGHIKLPSNEPRFTNPILETRFDVANGLIFEGLVGVDAKLEPVGRLAESWQLSDDGKVLTFKLRAGAVWQDGQKVTAQDVAFTFDAVKNTTAATVWKGYMAPVVKLETPDDATVVATYAQPYAPAVMTWTMPILPKHVYGKGELATSTGNTEPVGSGPFRLSRWEPGKRMLLEANDKWWYGRPNLDSIELVFGIGDGATLDALRHGQIDWAPVRNVGDWVNVAQAGDFRGDYEESDVLESRIRLIAWNTQRAPLDDKRVRQALTLALDRRRVIDDVLLGQAQSLSAPFFPTMFGADPSIAPWPFDLARAKALLDQVAPLKDGKRFTLNMISIESQRGAVSDETIGIFRHDLETLGVDLKLTLLPAREYFDRVAKHDYDADYFGWLPDIPDPDPYALLHSSQIAAGPNYAGYTSAEVDKLLDQARGATSRDARRLLYAKIHAIVADELPYTPLYAPLGHYAWSRRLRGVNPRDLGPQILFPGVARWWVVQRAAPRAAP